MVKKVNIKSLFLGLQKEMSISLSSNRDNGIHAPTIGDVSENKWKKLLQNYLPKRYNVDKAFVIDAEGNKSDQIDLVIYDRLYSPFLFCEDGNLLIPAESVYAMFEVKQELNNKNLIYANKKAMSVKRLHRTSTSIHHAGGIFTPKKLFPILAGILTTCSSWKEIKPNLHTYLKKNKKQSLDIGCVLSTLSFDVINSKKTSVEYSSGDDVLIFFFLRLIKKLQFMGTVSAIDVSAYEKSLK